MKVRSLLDMTAPCREDFQIPFHEIGDPAKPLSVALVAGIHGNELNGVFILSRLADYLSGVAKGRYPGVSLHGRVVVVPAVNVLGLNLRMRLWPFDKTDINRMFPGYAQGETTQRIAAAVLQATRDAAYRIDFHASNLEIEEMPHLRLYDSTPEERRRAESFGLTILENPIDAVLSVSLIHAWKQTPGENFVLRGGNAGELQLEHCERLFHALLQFFSAAGILTGNQTLAHEDEAHYFGATQSFRLITDQAGFFVSKQKVGHWIQAGDLLGVLYDGYTGAIREEVRAPKAGLLLALRRQPLAFQGDLVARLLTRKAQP